MAEMTPQMLPLRPEAPVAEDPIRFRMRKGAAPATVCAGAASPTCTGYGFSATTTHIHEIIMTCSGTRAGSLPDHDVGINYRRPDPGAGHGYHLHDDAIRLPEIFFPVADQVVPALTTTCNSANWMERNLRLFGIDSHPNLLRILSGGGHGLPPMRQAISGGDGAAKIKGDHCFFSATKAPRLIGVGERKAKHQQPSMQ
jgi:hypothetical protein